MTGPAYTDDELGRELEAAHAAAERRQSTRRNFRDKPAEQTIADDLVDALMVLHRDTGGQCATCHDPAGHPELYPCPTLRTARRLIRMNRR